MQILNWIYQNSAGEKVLWMSQISEAEMTNDKVKGKWDVVDRFSVVRPFMKWRAPIVIELMRNNMDVVVFFCFSFFVFCEPIWNELRTCVCFGQWSFHLDLVGFCHWLTLSDNTVLRCNCGLIRMEQKKKIKDKKKKK